MLAVSVLLASLCLGTTDGGEEKSNYRPERFETLVNPACSHCVDEARRKAGELRDDDRVLAWIRGKYDGGAIPVRWFLVPYRVISDTYGVFVYDPDAGFMRGYPASLDYRFHGWRNGVMVMRHRDGTLFDCLTGEAIEGPRKGERLTPIPTIETDWGPWLKANPGTVAYQMVAKFQPQPLPETTSAESRQTRPRPDRRLDPDERVFGLAVGGSSDAWPLAGFGHGVVARQVTVGGRPATLLWDGRTRTAAAYAPETEDAPKQPVTLVVDATNREAPWTDKETGSRWSITGRAVAGPLRGKSLAWLPGVMVKWYAWSASYPQTALDGRPAAADGTSEAQTTWKAGTARVAITPDKPLWMAGYATRTRPAEGKETELYAKALALEDARGTRLVMVTLDLIGVPRTLRKNLEKRCGEAYKLPPEGLLLNASHTHSGPEFRVGRIPWDDGNLQPTRDSEAYGQQLEEQLFKLVGEALDHPSPARLGYTHARAGFAMNRRLPTPKGYRNSPNPDGPVDQAVPVLRVVGEDGKLRAVVFGYACHNTSLALYKWNADYAGYAQEFVQAAHPGALALFMMGCGGDQNPYPRSTVELARQHGRALANGVETALAVAPRAVHGPLRCAYGEVDLDYDTIPTREEFRQRLGSKNKNEAETARRFLARLDAGETLPTRYPCPVQVVRFGDDLVLVALGGETCVDYSLRLKQELAGKAAVWIAGYSNDVMGYVPSRRVREEGGYEAADAMRTSRTHPAPWAPTLEEKIIGKVHELDRGLGH